MLKRKSTIVGLMVIVTGILFFPIAVLAEDTAKININTADVEKLTTLKGIGDVCARNIVKYRVTNGPFKNIEQIKEVKGIGEKTFEKIKNKITVGPPDE